MNDTETLKGLIEMAVERHQTSARQLAFKAQEAGLKITYTTLNQLRSNTYKSTPGEQTLKAIAYLAGVDESVAFTAAGQPVPGPPLADELPPGSDNLSPKSRKAVVEMVRVLVELEKMNDDSNMLLHGIRQRGLARNPLSAQLKTMRDRMAAADPTGQGQKIEPSPDPDPDGSIIEFHGTEAEQHPAPPIESLAAHPKVKTKREQLDEESGDL